ncbi:RE1 [Symbiodinium sp. CCMP2456]|nr:RE1 [Symbiodinium sp. CCMP2456]
MAKAKVIEDHTGDPIPEDAMQVRELNVDEEGERRGVPRPRLEPVPVPLIPVDAPGETPQQEVPEPPVLLPPVNNNEGQATDAGQRPRQVTPSSEPEREVAPQTSDGVPENNGDRPQAPQPPSSSTADPFSQRLRAAMESAYRNDVLDDALPKRRARVTSGEGAGPVRDKEDQTVSPYFAQDDYMGDDGLDELAAKWRKEAAPKPCRDHWELLLGAGTLRRHHVKWRTHPFSPWEGARMPVDIRDRGSTRTVVRCYKSGDQDEEEDDWKATRPSRKAASKWKGYTDFYLTKAAVKRLEDVNGKDPEHYHIEIQTADVFKMATDEVNERSISPEEWEGWKQTDAEEWAKLQASGAVKVLSVEDSKKVIDQLTREGRQNRILSSRMVRRHKPSEQPGEPSKRKSRLVIRGFEDPDAHRLDRSCGDLKQAFTQSDPLQRKAGKIYMWQPSSGLPGLEANQIIEVLHGVYGLIDAPLHWRRTLKTYLTEELEYKQSRLDPCVFVLYHKGKLNGVIVVEIDDLLCFGLDEHERRLQKLRQRFAFGKFHRLQEMPQGTAFNGRRIRQQSDYSLKVDMCKFVTERLSQVFLEKGRRSQPDAEASPKERQDTRAAIGSLAWAAKEGRPDAASGASILASRMAKLKVRDVVALNKVIQEVRSKPELTLTYHSVPLERLRFGVATDASFDNYDDGSSQGAVGVLAYDVALTEGETAKCSLLWWKSAKLRRKVPSTLAAETQALNRGLGELLWTKALWENLLDPNFDLQKYMASIKDQSDVVLQRADCDQKLRESLSIVDAKSVYDNVIKDGAQAADKYTALEVAIARERSDGLGVQIRWVEHQAMVVDALTKVGANPQALYRLLDTGHFRITAEEQQMVERAELRAIGRVKPR